MEVLQMFLNPIIWICFIVGLITYIIGYYNAYEKYKNENKHYKYYADKYLNVVHKIKYPIEIENGLNGQTVYRFTGEECMVLLGESVWFTSSR